MLVLRYCNTGFSLYNMKSSLVSGDADIGSSADQICIRKSDINGKQHVFTEEKNYASGLF